MSRNLAIFDLHNDILTADFGVSAELVAACEAVSAEFIAAVWTSRLSEPNIVFKVASKHDFWAVEDLGFIDSREKANNFLESFSPIYASLTWNDENFLAGGAGSNGNLKPLGEFVIAGLESKNIVLDMAHLNRESFFSAAKVAKKPFICSHTCFDGVFCHHRNLTDQQIGIIIDSGGIIGLTFVAEFMGIESAGIDDVVRQINYFRARFPLENLAIGSDFFGTDTPALKNYQELEELATILQLNNYSTEEIDGIFYKNAKNFIFGQKNRDILGRFNN